MQKEWLVTSQRGFSSVEAILAVSIFALLVTALTGAYIYGQESVALAGNRARAAMLAEEGLEAIRNIRDSGFASLSDGVYGLAISGGQWNLSGTSDTTDIFTRQVAVSTVDAKRKEVSSRVDWQQNPQRTGVISLVSRFTNWIVAGIGNWAIPIQEASADISGNNNGVKVQISGNYVYLIRDSGAPNFAIIDVSDPTMPSLVGSLTLTGVPSNLFVSGNYTYVANSDNSQELQVIDITTPTSPNVVGIYNAPGNANAFGLHVDGAIAYLVRASSANDEFLAINVATPSSPSLIGSLDLGADGNEVIVSGAYAYIASASNSQELQIISIATPSSPSLIGSLNLLSNTNANTVSIADSTVYIGQGSTLYTVNISVPTAPSQLGSVDTSGTINDIALNLGNSNTYLFIATSDNSLEFQVIDVSAPASLALLGSVDTAGNSDLNGVAYDVTLDRAFGVSDSNSAELIIFAPQ